MYDDNTFYQLESDEFHGIDDIPTVYPRNPFDEDGADNIFGLGNKQKKAERKLAKAEKKLAKGNVKAATRKIAKAEKLLGKVETGVSAKQPAIDAARLRSSAITNATNPAQTENLSTDAGQIGMQGGTPIMQPSQVGGGGGGGDMGGGSMDMGYSPETNLANPTAENTTPSDEPTGDLATVKDLQGVTVTAGKKNNLMLLIIIGALLLLAIWYFSKHKSLKLK
jgi:hypothetical protein